MDRQVVTPIVLARIPDLRIVGPEAVDKGRLPSGGWLISQALSFKLLAGTILLLMVMAVVPFFIKGSGLTAAPPSSVEPSTVWPSASSALLPTKPTPPPMFSDNTAAAPSPVADRAVPIPDEIPQSVAADSRPTPTPTETPLMSTWPNPTHPTTVSATFSENPPVRANQAMAIRPTEYLRNSYDRTGSGIH